MRSLSLTSPDTDVEHAADFWAPASGPLDDDVVDDRPTIRPTGDGDFDGASGFPGSGVHCIVPAERGDDVESIEAALQKLLAG